MVLVAINTITFFIFLILLVVKLTEFVVVVVGDACEEMSCSKESEEVLRRRYMAFTVGIALVIYGIGLGMIW